MLLGYSPTIQALLGTLFTWLMTAGGAATVFVFSGYKRSFLDASLGFSAGVMTAASFWSLLLPALEITAETYDNNKLMSLLPVLIGLILGALFVYLTDIFLPDDYVTSLAAKDDNLISDDESTTTDFVEKQLFVSSDSSSTMPMNKLRQRSYAHNINKENSTNQDSFLQSMNDTSNNNNYYSTTSTQFRTSSSSSQKTNAIFHNSKYRKILLLIIAVTVHNIPEGLAVGVGFGAVGRAKSATFESARNLAIGIGIQNFPEGLAVSLPLYASGFSRWRSFWYGQLSGMVEPIAGVLGAFGIAIAQSILPYALAFAAGAMLYVVFENIMPEASSHGNSKLSTWFCMIGFCIMMCLDVGLN